MDEKKPARRPVFLLKLITSKQQEPKQLVLEQQRPKLQEQQRLEQQRQQLELELVLVQQLELLEQLLELVGLRWSLLFSSKQPEQQPAGKRSAGIFSWGFP